MGKISTYQTRLAFDISSKESECLNEYALLLSTVERKLYADYRKGQSIIKNKKEYLKSHGITARQFNAIRVNLQGKIDSVLTRHSDYIFETKEKIKYLTQKIKRLSKKESLTAKEKLSLHQKKRKLTRLKHKLKILELDKKSKIARICFGSKKLFKRQFNLPANNYSRHEEWRVDWQDSRNSQFFLLGSKDETSGNQSCVAVLNEDGGINLKLRLPNRLVAKHGKYLEIDNLKFKYGNDVVISAIKENMLRSKLRSKRNSSYDPNRYKSHGQAINFRFLRDSKGWRLFVTTKQHVKPKYASTAMGSIGVDINVDHLAVAEIDRTGNYINSFKIPCVTYGKTKEQAKAIIGDAIKALVDYAVLKEKPLVIENLDFKNKKSKLGTQSKKYSRMLSSFSYSMICQYIESRAYRNGVSVFKVNPAYSSVIGRCKFARIYKGLSVHTSAAMVIARRESGFSERLPRCWDNIPSNTGGYFTLSELVKIQDGHIWRTWSKVMRNVQAALVEQYQINRHLCNASALMEEDIPL